MLGDMEEDGIIEGDWLMLDNIEEDGAVDGGGKGLMIGNVVGFDFGFWEEEGVCVGLS